MFVLTSISCFCLQFVITLKGQYVTRFKSAAEFIKQKVSLTLRVQRNVCRKYIFFVSVSILCQVNIYFRSLIFFIKQFRKVYVSNLKFKYFHSW
jgi:hypothetical protein